MKIAILGGTGNLGYALALRWARLGHNIVIGSRNKEKAIEAANLASMEAKGPGWIGGETNRAALQGADLVVLAIPGRDRRDFLMGIADQIDGSIILDTTIPLQPGPEFSYDPPPEGSNAQETKAILGRRGKVAAAFHTVSANLLKDLKKQPSSDILVVSDDAEAKTTILDLVESMGLRGFDGGSLANAQTIERLTPLIINLNKKYKKRHISLKLTGV